MSRMMFAACAALLWVCTFIYYPKWCKNRSEAVISWDVAGYYAYLPAVFIYHDLKQLNWVEKINAQYYPDEGANEAYRHPSGNMVIKYSAGQALQLLPWFSIAHLLAAPLGFAADGYSRPYQLAISVGSFLVALLGLWYFRRVLLYYFSDQVTALILLCIVWGSNYAEYAGISAPMTHNWLFTLYSLLIFNTIQFYNRPTYGRAALIGLLVGWATLTRPTEIVAVCIPLLWQIRSLRLESIWKKIPLAALTAGAIMSLQPVYWKYVAGEWLVYSYTDQGFTWFPPHIEDVLWSARAGWWVYSPMMLFAAAGLFFLPRSFPALAPALMTTSLLSLYITSAWDIWWYGGSLGQRALVGVYPLWAFGLGAFILWATKNRVRKVCFGGLGLICIYLNLWWIHQAHRGGYFVPEQMTRAYILHILGRWNLSHEAYKLLDTKEVCRAQQHLHSRQIFFEGFERDTTIVSGSENAVSGLKSMALNKAVQYSPKWVIPVADGERTTWYRCALRFQCAPKEWAWYRMAQCIITFKKGDTVLKTNMIRLQRHVQGQEKGSIFFDTRAPADAFDKIELYIWNAESDKTIFIDDIQLTAFNT